MVSSTIKDNGPKYRINRRGSRVLGHPIHTSLNFELTSSIAHKLHYERNNLMNNTISIYNNPADLTTFISKDFTVEELLQLYHTSGAFGNRAKVIQCCICAKVQQTLKEKYDNKTNCKAYKEEARKFIRSSNITSRVFQQRSQIGNYVLEQNDPELYDKNLSDIGARFLPHVEKQKRDPVSKILKSEYDTLLAKYDEIVAKYEQLKAENKELSTVIEQLCGELDAHSA